MWWTWKTSYLMGLVVVLLWPKCKYAAIELGEIAVRVRSNKERIINTLNSC